MIPLARLGEGSEVLGFDTPMSMDHRVMVGSIRAFVNSRLAFDIDDPAVRRIAERRQIGSIDQFSDSTDLRCGTEFRRVLRELYT